LKALVRLSGNARLSFDADAAGLAATERSIPIAQTVGMELSIISVTGGAKDPDELIKQDPALWQQAIDTAEPVVDWILAQYSKREDLTSAAGKRTFTTAGLNVVRALNDPVEKEHYVQKIAVYTGSSIETLMEKLNATPETEQKALKKIVQTQSAPVNRDATAYQDTLLSLFAVYPKTHDLTDDLNADMFPTDERKALFTYVVQHPGANFDEVPRDLQDYDTYVKIVVLKADARYGEWNDEDRYLEAARLIRQLTTEHKQHQKNDLTTQLRDAESNGDTELATRIRTTLNTLIKEIPTDGKK